MNQCTDRGGKWPPDQMFRHIKTLAMALAGKEDFNVPSEHAIRIARIIHEAGNTNVASLLLSACDHNFQWLPPDHDHDTAFRERYTFESFKGGYNTNVHAAMIGWLRKVIPSPVDPALTSPAAPTNPSWQRAIQGPELDLKTDHTPERLQLAPGIKVSNSIIDPARTAGMETLEGRIGPLLLGEGCQAHFIDMPSRMYAEEHPPWIREYDLHSARPMGIIQSGPPVVNACGFSLPNRRPHFNGLRGPLQRARLHYHFQRRTFHGTRPGLHRLRQRYGGSIAGAAG